MYVGKEEREVDRECELESLRRRAVESNTRIVGGEI